MMITPKPSTPASIQSFYLHLYDSLESFRLGRFRLKLGSSVQFLWRDTIEVSLATHLPIILLVIQTDYSSRQNAKVQRSGMQRPKCYRCIFA